MGGRKLTLFFVLRYSALFLVFLTLVDIPENIHRFQELQPIHTGGLTREFAWSVDGRYFVFLGAGGESAVSLNESNWFQYDTVSGIMSRYSTWPLQPTLNDEERSAFMPAALGRTTFIFESPNQRFIAYAMEETHELAVADRQIMQFVVVPPSVSLPAPTFGPDQFNILWSEDSTAFTVMYTPSSGDGTNFGTIYVAGYSTNLSDAFNLYIGETRFDQRSFQFVIHDISDCGELVLLSGIEINPEVDPNDFNSRLILWNSASPENSQVMDFDAEKVRGASFAPEDESKLLIVNEQGLVEYDIEASESHVVRPEIRSDWITRAIFSPTGQSVALIQQGEPTTDIFVVNLTDDI